VQGFVSLFFFLFYYLAEVHSVENTFYHDSPHSIEIQRKADLVDQRWEAFQDELRWYLVYTAPATRITEKFSGKNKEEYEGQEAYLKEKWTCEHDTLAQNLACMQEAFLEFREKTALALASDYGDGQYASTMSARAELELTKWYTEYVENNLFPVKWKELYQQFVKSKAKKNQEKDTPY